MTEYRIHDLRLCLLATGETAHRLAGIAGVHFDDMHGFLAGDKLLTFAAHQRLASWLTENHGL